MTPTRSGTVVFEAAAPAKLNLNLHVVGRQPRTGSHPGHHELDTLVTFAEIGDTVHVAPNPDDPDAIALAVAGPFGPSLLAASRDPSDNLVLRAASGLRLLAQRLKHPRPLGGWGARIHLDKRLPLSSGMGGGSTDAAAAISALLELWTLPRSLEALPSFLTLLGADVPMCFARRSLRARGIGEAIEPVDLPALPLVLANPGVPSSTPAIFRALDGRFSLAQTLPDDLATPSALITHLVATSNDLQAPAVETAPVIQAVLDALLTTDPRLARMTGSGATCFAVFDSSAEAEAAATHLSAAHPRWWIKATRTIGPAP